MDPDEYVTVTWTLNLNIVDSAGKQGENMSDDAVRTTRRVFILRLWREQSESSAWRGQVEHVPTGQKVAFSTLPEILEYIVSQLEAVDYLSHIDS